MFRINPPASSSSNKATQEKSLRDPRLVKNYYYSALNPNLLFQVWRDPHHHDPVFHSRTGFPRDGGTSLQNFPSASALDPAEKRYLPQRPRSGGTYSGFGTTSAVNYYQQTQKVAYPRTQSTVSSSYGSGIEDDEETTISKYFYDPRIQDFIYVREKKAVTTLARPTHRQPIPEQQQCSQVISDPNFLQVILNRDPVHVRIGTSPAKEKVPVDTLGPDEFLCTLDMFNCSVWKSSNDEVHYEWVIDLPK